MNNIIVFGLKRTGTSLMVQILGENKEYIINKDNRIESNPIYNDLQEYYNEGQFISGITVKNYHEYIKLKNNVIKMMNNALINTNLNIILKFKKIFVMNRYWIDQISSNNNLHILNTKNLYHKIKNKINCSIDELYKDYKFDDGIEYGYCYSNLIIDMVRRKYYSNVIIINFEDLINEPNHVREILIKHGLDISDGLKLIKKSQTKYITKNRDKIKDLVEFKKGYFNFLDQLYTCIKKGKINNYIIELIKKWFPFILKNINDRNIRLKVKYKLKV